MKFNIHAGHNPSGRIACGALGLLDESKEARTVKNKLIEILKKQGNRCYDCTVNNGISQIDVLRKIVNNCNKHVVDMDISIHFNSGRNDKKGDDKTGGVECYVYDKSSKVYKTAAQICKNISKLGFTNRGVKVNKSLYFLNHSNNPAILIECCFVDDRDDYKLYNSTTMACAIARALTGSDIAIEKLSTPNSSISPFKIKVNCDLLNIRCGASTNNSIIGTVHKNDVYTIIAVKNSWGLLKSGIGWINISDKYVKKLE